MEDFVNQFIDDRYGKQDSAAGGVEYNKQESSHKAQLLLNEDSDVDNIIEEEEETIIFTKSKTSQMVKTYHDFSQSSSIKSRIIRKGKKPKKNY